MHGVWAGKSGWMGWRSHNSPTSSRISLAISFFSLSFAPPPPFFSQAGSLQLSQYLLKPRMALSVYLLLQGVDHFKKIQYADGITYGELFFENEQILLPFSFQDNVYDQLLKTSQAFNILDSRGFVGNRACSLFQLHVQVSLTRQCAQLWLETQESLGHPLGFVPKSVEHVCPKEVLEAAVKKVHHDPRLFVLELGTVDMPPHDLKDLMSELLDKQRLNLGDIQAFGTPHRLVV
ncbi:hypothetical protein SCA6_013404 [Theobroma cacao]